MEEKIIFSLELDDSQVEKQLADNEVALKRNREERARLNKEVKAGKITEDEYGLALTRVNKSTKELQKEQRVLNNVTNASENSIDGLRAKLSALTATSNQLDFNTEEFDKVEKEIAELNAEIAKFEERRGDFRRSVGNYGKAAGGLTTAFNNIGTSITAALGPAALIATLATGIAKLFEFTTALQKTREEVNLLTGQTGDQLDATVAKVQATADAFDQDFSSVLLAANNLAQGFGITVEEATDKLQQGFAAGADVTGELLPITTEYSKLLGEVGLTADETIAIVQRQVTEGVFSDKGIDSIKEASIRLREFTPATREALDNIGISSTELQKSIEDGTVTTFEAIQRVSARLGELPAQSNEVGTAIADIFGGAGEDASLSFLTTLDEVSSSLDEVVEGAGEVADANLRIANANEELNLLFNQLFGGASDGFNSIKAAALEFLVDALQFVINGIVDTINFFIELRNESLIVRAGFEFLAASVETAFDLVVTQINVVVDAIAGIGNVIRAVLTGDFASIPDIITDAFGNIGDEFTEFGKQAGENFNEAIESALDESDPIEKISLTSDQQDEVAETFAEAGRKSAEAVELSRTQQLQDLENFLKRQLLTVEEGSQEQLDLQIRLRQVERDLALQDETLRASQRALIIAEAFKDEQQLTVDFQQAQLARQQEALDLELQNIADNETRKQLLLQQSFLNQEIDEQTFNENLFQIREEAIQAEITQFEEGTLARLEKEVELEELRQERLNEIKQQEQESTEAVAKAQLESDKARADSVGQLAGAIAGAAEDGSAAQEAAQAIGSGVALAEVGFNLGQELSANAAAGAKIAAAGAPATIPAGAAYTTTQNIKAFAGAAANTIRIVSSLFDEGGVAFDNLAFSGGSIPRAGGMINGLPHSLGGVKFDMGGGRIGEADGNKGEAYIVNTNNDPRLKAIASNLNVAGGGKSFYNYGGIVKFQEGGAFSNPDLFSNSVISDVQNSETLLDIIENLPAQKVLVDDIDDGLSTKTAIENLATN